MSSESREHRQESPETGHKVSRRKNILRWSRKLWVVGAALLALAGLSSASIYYIKYKDALDHPAQTHKTMEGAETARVLASLGKVLKIEAGQNPTVARIESPDQLKRSNPTFYADAQKGDYLVVFSSRAVIYRESTNQLINIVPIVNQSQQP